MARDDRDERGDDRNYQRVDVPVSCKGVGISFLFYVSDPSLIAERAYDDRDSRYSSYDITSPDVFADLANTDLTYFVDRAGFPVKPAPAKITSGHFQAETAFVNVAGKQVAQQAFQMTLVKERRRIRTGEDSFGPDPDDFTMTMVHALIVEPEVTSQFKSSVRITDNRGAVSYDVTCDIQWYNLEPID